MNKHLIAIAATAIAVTGCATQPAPAPVAAANYNEGIAKTCNASQVDFSASTAGTATIAMTNDGWCAVRAKDKNGEPFKFGLVKSRPQHGYILIEKVGSETRIEYTVDNRYVGTDNFSVALASNLPNTPDLTIQVAVDATRGEGVALPGPATPPAPTPRTPTRRAPARTSSHR